MTSGDIRALLERADLPEHVRATLREWLDASEGALSTLADETALDDAGLTAGFVASPSARPAPPREATLGVIGVGGMGEVLRIHDPDLDRPVAMKVLGERLGDSAEHVARFVREAQITARLQHPGVVPVYRLGRMDDGRPYFTMREVHGRTLTELINDAHAGVAGTSMRRVIDAFARVCETVGYAHGHRVVHRDLKPANLMVGEHGEVLVLDWGLAKVVGEADDGADPLVPSLPGLTRTGSLAGTPAYMAPEQAFGQPEAVDERTDVYALGVVLYEVLAGHRAYTGSDGRTVVDAVKARSAPTRGRP